MGCESLGAHFNPDHEEHSGYGEHTMAGDLDEAVSDKSGVAQIWQETDRFDLYGTFNVIGRSMVIHKKSEADGNGARVACCVIGRTAPKKAAYNQGYSNGYGGY